jgi:hypothetical protein
MCFKRVNGSLIMIGIIMVSGVQSLSHFNDIVIAAFVKQLLALTS